jgi:hypothetical protein
MQGGELVFTGEEGESAVTNADQVNAAWDKLTIYSDAMWNRVMEDGASMLWMRGLLAFGLPGSPRFFFEEERELDAYYQGRSAAKGDGIEFRRTSIDDVTDYIGLWAADPAGGQAVRRFMDDNPSMLPYLIGKTFWGPGGTPPLERDQEEFFADMANGLVQPMPYGPWRTRESIRNNEYDRQLAVQAQYGQNPHEVAAMTISDPEAYNKMSQQYTQTHEMILWEDDLRGSEYKGWKERNRDNNFSIREEAIRKYNNMSQTLSDTIQMIEVTPLLNVAEQKEAANALKAMKAGLSGFIDEMRTGDQNYDFLSGWQQLRMRWFEEAYVPYLDALSPLYDELAESNTDAQQDVIWNKIAQVQDVVGDAEVMIDGYAFPPPNVFKWNNKDPEIREASLLQNVTYKAAWLDTATTDRLLDMEPTLEKYLPSTPKQRNVWNQYNTMYEKIDAEHKGGQEGGISQKLRDKKRKDLEGQLRSILLESGETDQLLWMDFWPIQKLNEAKQLPPTLQNSEWIGYVNSIQRVRAANGYKSVGDDDDARRAMTRMLQERIASDPIFRAELIELGVKLYGEELPESIIPQLFFNDRY